MNKVLHYFPWSVLIVYIAGHVFFWDSLRVQFLNPEITAGLRVACGAALVALAMARWSSKEPLWNFAYIFLAMALVHSARLNFESDQGSGFRTLFHVICVVSFWAAHFQQAKQRFNSRPVEA